MQPIAEHLAEDYAAGSQIQLGSLSVVGGWVFLVSGLVISS